MSFLFIDLLSCMACEVCHAQVLASFSDPFPASSQRVPMTHLMFHLTHSSPNVTSSQVSLWLPKPGPFSLGTNQFIMQAKLIYSFLILTFRHKCVFFYKLFSKTQHFWYQMCGLCFLKPTYSPPLQTPTRCLTVQFNSDVNCLELLQSPQVKSLVPQG